MAMKEETRIVPTAPRVMSMLNEFYGRLPAGRSQTAGTGPRRLGCLQGADTQHAKPQRKRTFDLFTPWYGHKPVLVSSAGLCPETYPTREVIMTECIATILADPALGLTATDRLILLLLAQSPAGSRVEDIAHTTGSKYRWVENEVSKLTRLGVIRRIGPNTYTINADYGVKP